MKTLHAAFATAFVLASTMAVADENSSTSVLEIITQKIDGIKKLQVGGYRQAWGKQDADIDNMIAQASASGAATSDLLTAIAAATSSARQTRGAPQSCVISLVVVNNGVYASTRDCTTQLSTKTQMNTEIYPSLSAYLVGRLPNIDFAQDNSGFGYATFYTPDGHVSEFIVFTNATR